MQISPHSTCKTRFQVDAALCRIAIALEIFQFCVSTVGAESTLDLVDCLAASGTLYSSSKLPGSSEDGPLVGTCSVKLSVLPPRRKGAAVPVKRSPPN